jgi:hypothetical protein
MLRSWVRQPVHLSGIRIDRRLAECVETMFGLDIVLAAAITDGQWLSQLPMCERSRVLRGRMLKRLLDKETNMRNRLARRRAAIWAKWWSRFGILLAFSIAIPLCISLLGFLWNMALHTTLG